MNESVVETVSEFSNSWFFAAFSNGFWVFVGIVAGTLVTILSFYISGKIQKRKIKNNIKFEISFNIQKIQEWKGMLNEVLEASNSDSMQELVIFFDFQKIILWTVNKTISEGTVYDYLDTESIVTLQKLVDFSTLFYSEKINNEIKNYRNDPDRASVAKLVKFWKSMLDEHETKLRLIESKL